MNKRTKNNGITLISLVITIIVMLILVGVSITLAVNGGLFDYAGKAVGDTKNAIKDENNLEGLQVGDTWYDSIGDYMDGIGWITIYDGSEPAGEDGAIALSEKISEQVKYRITIEGIGKVEANAVSMNEPLYILFVINGDEIITFESVDDLMEKVNSFTDEEIEKMRACIVINGETDSQIAITDMEVENVDVNYKITKIEKCNFSNLKIMWKKGELKVGDYVDYTPSGEITEINVDDPENKGNASGTLTGYTSKQIIETEDLKWQVLGYDEEKDKLLLISENPTTEYITFDKYVGWNNYEDVLNNTCKALYSNTSMGAVARSITMEDIDKYLDGDKYDKTELTGGSDKAGGYGYRNESVESKFDIDENGKLVELETGTVTLDLTGNTYAYIVLNEGATDLKKAEILNGKVSKDSNYWVATKGVGVNSSGAYWEVGEVDCVVSENDEYSWEWWSVVTFDFIENNSNNLATSRSSGCLRVVIEL